MEKIKISKKITFARMYWDIFSEGFFGRGTNSKGYDFSAFGKDSK